MRRPMAAQEIDLARERLRAPSRILAMSTWQESANERRDFRQAKGPPDSNRSKPARGQKDRQRWCGGREGREHNYLWRPYPMGYMESTPVEICSACGRHGRIGWVFPWTEPAETRAYRQWLEAHA